MKSLILMLQFFTRIPIRYQVDVNKVPFTKGLPFFPFVGFVVGGIDAIVFLSISFVLPSMVAAIATVLCNVLVTGGLHYDGLADTCDGIFSARSREKMLEIMKDSRIGTNGALALCFDIGLKVILLSQLSDEVGINKTALMIIGMTMIAKMMLVLVILLSKQFGKDRGLGSLFIGAVGTFPIAMSFLAASIILFLMLGNIVLVLMPANILITVIFKRYIIRKLGVMSGDTMGAFNEISQLFVLFLCLVVVRNVAL